jgi:nitronate monooxygenase
MTRQLRAAGDPEAMSLWAGQAHEFAREIPAAELVESLSADARTAIAEASRRFS